MLPQSANNSAVAISANGNYCAIVAPTPQPINQSATQTGCEVFDYVGYYLGVGAGVSAGTAAFQVLGLDGVWRPLAVPAAITLVASTNFNGTIQGPFHGVRITIAALAGGNVTYAELTGSVRQSGF